MKLMPASNAASHAGRRLLALDAAGVGQPRAEADLGDLDIAAAELADILMLDEHTNALQ